ncbi:MAG: DUF5667 domain-containing protein [Gammaproteobacteria bacterium]
MLLSIGARAGHGFFNAFTDIEPLPPPGLTPDRVGYTLDTLAERAQLAIADDTRRVVLALGFAREKLAEADAMVRIERRAAAATAIAAYVEYIDSAVEALQTMDAAQRDRQARDLANALLAHQYLIALDYLDLPRTSRTIIGEVITAARGHYDRLVAELPRTFKEAQFFKEEEVRWTWELAEQADAQGL